MKKKPLFPYPPHKEKGLHNYLKDCKDFPKDENEMLFEDFSSNKKNCMKCASGKIDEITQWSSLFSANLGSKVITFVCADNGADVTLVDSAMLAKKKEVGIELWIEKLLPPLKLILDTYNPDGIAKAISCYPAVTIDQQLNILHGSALILRGISCIFTLQNVGAPLLWISVLADLGLYHNKFLTGAIDRLGGNVGVFKYVGN